VFDTIFWQRLFTPARRLRWRWHAWSSESDREFWNVQFTAPTHDPFSPSYPGHLTIRRFSDLAEQRFDNVSRVCDLGCGPGEITCEMARRRPAIRFVGIDHSEIAIQQARTHAARLGLHNVEFEPGDLETFDPPPGVDLITMFDAFHHVLAPDAFIARVGRACERLFLIEPAGTVLGAWNREHDLDWLPATVFQLNHRLEYEFGLGEVEAEQRRAIDRQTAAGPTEHRYTAADFQRFFKGFTLEVRGTIAGFEQYGPEPDRRSRMRDRFGDAAYNLVVAVEDAMFEEGLDLAAKHWAIYARRDRPGVLPALRPVRQPARKPLANGIQPAYSAHYSDYRGPKRVAPGEVFQVQVQVRNTGWQSWSSVEDPPVLASYHWLDGKHRVLVSDGLRTPLPMRIASGEEGGVLLRVQAPDTPGRAVLAIDFVHENVTWFSEQGVAPCEVEFVVRES
jgi:SAM-dependent methyltransferase